MTGMFQAVRGLAVSAAHAATLSLGQLFAVLTIMVGLLAFSPAAQAAPYSYTGGGETIVYNGAYSYWPGFSLYGESVGSGDNVSYFAYTIPAGKTYTSARLDFGFTVHSGGTFPLTFSALSSQPAASAAGINAVRTGTTLASIGSMTAGPVTLPASIVTQMNSLSAGGGGTLYVGAYGPLGQDYFGEFYQADLIGESMEPTVTGLSPTQGPTAGGTNVIITGTNLTGATMVTFAGTVATYVVNSATQITATAPTKTSGNADVRVTTAYGASANTAADNFTYVAGPTVTSISPTAGPTAGGTSVTITGTDFTGVTAVTFGATPATGFTVNSATSITATAPGGSAGTVDVRVTTGGGTSPTSAADQFTYVGAPTVTSITPTAGPTGGGTTVIITGTGFATVSGVGGVKFGATNASYTINSNTQITATAPSASAGTVDVTVTSIGGTSATSAADQYTYVAAPTVTARSPTSGPASGGTTVIITGTGFSGATAVTFGATSATGFTVNSATQITATSPAGTGTVDIRVTAVGGTSATSAADQFTYIAAPTVTSISPTAGSSSGGTSVTITGTNFTGATAVTFGATAATGFTVNSATSITATSPGGSPGTIDVRVTTAGGTSATSAADQFSYIGVPTVTSILPTAGPTGGGTTVTINGIRFSGATAVTFGATAATGFTVNSANQITATAPAGTGTVDVRITTIGGTSATNAADQYTYVAAPTASSFTYGSVIAYNDGADLLTSFNVGVMVVGSPTSYAVGSATTAQGGSVSISNTGQVSYVPPRGYRNANDSFTFTATNPGGTSSPATVTLTIGNPTFSVILPEATSEVGATYNSGAAAVTMSGGRAPYSNFSATGLPAGLTMDASGVISGTPTTTTVATVTVTATDSSTGAGAFTASATDTLTITAPTIVLTPATLTGIQAGAAYSQAITSTGGLGAKTYAISAGAFPPGLTLTPAGLLAGTPTTVGVFNFTITATDTAGFTGSRNYPVTVAPPSFTLLPAALPNASVAVAFGETIVAGGGIAPYAYTLAAGALPPGLTLSPTGDLSGVPTSSGTYNFTIVARDSTMGAGAPYGVARAYAITVGAPTVTVGPVSLPDATQETAYSQTMSASGGTAPYSYAVTAGALPAGLVLSPSGDLTGAPTVNGTFNFTVTATDSTGGGGPATGARAYSLVVAVPAPPTAGPASTTVPANSGGAPVTLNLTGTTATSVAVVTAPAHGTTSIAGLTITYTPATGFSGTDSFTYTATNAGGTSAPATFSVTVTQLTQTISFAPLSDASLSASPLTLSATAGSGLTVSFTSTTPTTCSVTGAALNLLQMGTCSVDAGQAGDGAWAAAPTVTRAFTVLPAILTISDGAPSGTVAGSPYSQANTAAGGVAPYTFALAAGAFPPGVTINPTTGLVSGTPTAAGTFNYLVQVTDSQGAPVTATTSVVSVTIAAPIIVIDTTSLPSATTAAAYSATITSSGGVGAMSYAVTAGALPAGASLSSTGALSGAPTASGTFNFTVTATDSLGFTGSRALSLTVTDPVIAVTAPSAGALPAGQGGVAYSQTFTATGGQGAHSFVLAGGTLPAGLTLSSAGVLSGTPTTAGSYSFAIRAMDSSPAPGPFSSPAVNYTLEIVIAVPVVTPKTATVIGGQSVTIDVAAGAVGFNLTSVAVASAPAHGTAVVNGMTIVYTANGAYSGPDSFTYTVSNPGGASLPGTVSITVNPAVVAGPPKEATIMAGQTATVELTEGATGAPFTAAAVVSLSPAGAGTATISPRTGPTGQLFDLIFAPDNAFTGQAVVTYTLSNAFATSAPGVVTITVEARPDPTVDPEVTGLISSQTEAARRFAGAQISNINRRLERLHGGGGTGGASGFSSSVSLGFGAAMAASTASDPSELRRMQDEYGVIGGLTGARLGYGGGASPSRTETPRASGPGGGVGGNGEGSGPWGVWISGAANFGTTDEAVDREGFEFSTDGLSIGADRRLGDALVFGMAAGWAHDVSKIGDNGTRSQADAWSLALYGSYQPADRAFFDVVLGYGRLDFDSRRYVTANGDFAYGERQGDQWFGAVTAGWDYKHPHGLNLSPYGRIEASRSLLDGFTEDGGGAFALAYDEQTTTTVTGALGLKGDYAFKTSFGQAIPNFRIEYAYDLQGTGSARLRYADWLDGEVYELGGSPLDKNRMLYGLGLDLIRKSGLRFGLDYEGMLSGDQTSSTVRIQLETPF